MSIGKFLSIKGSTNPHISNELVDESFQGVLSKSQFLQFDSQQF